MSPRLEMLTGPLAGQVLPIKGPSLSIGRVAGNDLVLDDATVSRRHALIVVDAGGALIRDLGSRNGIVIEGRPAREGRLAHGSRFSIGRISCRLLLEDGQQARPPASPAPAPASPERPFDRRFAAFLAAALAVMVAVLAAWYWKAHRPPERTERTIAMREGEERYEPDRPFREYVFRDPAGILEKLGVYPSAIAFRAQGQGDAGIELTHEDGTRTVLTVVVRGRRSPPPGFEPPADAAGDRARLDAYCESRLAEAKVLVGEGQWLKALTIAQGIRKQYRDVVPKPAFAVEVSRLVSAWEGELDRRLAQLEEEMRLKSDRRDYEGVERALYRMRELVETDSADHQRLKFLLKLNQQGKQDAQPKEGR